MEPWPHSAPDSSWTCHAKPFLPQGLCTPHSLCPECLSPAGCLLCIVQSKYIVCKYRLLRGFQCSPVPPSQSLCFFTTFGTPAIITVHLYLLGCSLSVSAYWNRSPLRPGTVTAPSCRALVPRATLGYSESSCKSCGVNKILFNFFLVLKLLEFLSLLLSSLVQTLTIRYSPALGAPRVSLTQAPLKNCPMVHTRFSGGHSDEMRT